MPKELAMLSIHNNKITTVSDLNELSEEKVLNMLNTIKEQSKQLTSIKQFYDEFKYFKTLNFKVNGLINNIKKDPNKIYELQHLSRLLARYSYSFRDFVTFSDQYVVKHNSANLKKNLISFQFDNFYEYRLANTLGNFVKHVSQLVPISNHFDENTNDFFIRIDRTAEIYDGARGQDKKTLQEKTELDLLDFLDVTMECVLVQTQCIIKQIFVDDNAGEYFKTTDKFIYEYGIPCFIENKNIQWFRNDITYLGEEVTKIINEFGISKIKTPKKMLPINN